MEIKRQNIIFLEWFNWARRKKHHMTQEWCSSEKFGKPYCGQWNVRCTRQWKARKRQEIREILLKKLLQWLTDSLVRHYKCNCHTVPALVPVYPQRRRQLEIQRELIFLIFLPLTESRAVAEEEVATPFSRWTAEAGTIRVIINVNMTWLNMWTVEIRLLQMWTVEISPLLGVSWSRCRAPRSGVCIATWLSSRSQPPRRRNQKRHHYRHNHLHAAELWYSLQD